MKWTEPTAPFKDLSALASSNVYRRLFVGLSLTILAGCSEASLKTVNAVPTASINSHSDGDTLPEEATSNLFAKVSDTNHSAESLVVNWYVNGDLVCEDQTPESDGYTLCVTPLPTGSVRILVEASDPKGASGNDSVTVDIQPSTPPDVTLLNPFEEGRYFTDTPIEFQGRIFDLEDTFDKLTVSLTSSLQGNIDVDTTLDADGLFSSYGNLDSGVHVITLAAVDSSGKEGSDEAVITVDVPNGIPDIEAVDILPDPATAADPLVCTYTGFSDPDGDADVSTIAWTINGVPAGTGNSLESGYVGGDEVACLVTPSDGEDEGDPVGDTIIISNTGPVVESVFITPDEGVTTSTELVCNAIISDIDDETLTADYTWTHSDGSTLGMGDTLGLSPMFVRPGDIIRCTAAVTDAGGETAVGNAEVEIENNAPRVTSIEITPSTATTNDTLTAMYSATDDDGSPVTVRLDWHVNSISTGETGMDLDGGLHFAKNDRVTVIATPDDGAMEGDPVESSEVLILNSPPGAPEIRIDGSGIDEPCSTDCPGLICIIDVAPEDADSDVVSTAFSWDVDGVPYTDTDTTTEPADTVPRSAVTDGETWTCTVTTNDGDDDGGSATASITVEIEEPDDGVIVEGDCASSSTADASFMVCRESVSIAAARTRCTDAGYDDLASIRNEEENTLVVLLLDTITGGSYGEYVFGLSDNASEGTWVWFDGSTSTYRNWRPPNPDDAGGGQDFGYFPYPLYGGEWDDGFSSTGARPTGYICSDHEEEPEEEHEETYGDVTGESGLEYACSDCFACPEETWYIADKAFDDNRGTAANSWHTTWSGEPEWVQVDFGEGNEKIIRHYGLMGAAFRPDYSARDWQLLASDDGESWTTMHEVYGASLVYVMWGGEPFTYYEFANETPYRFWRVYVTENMGAHELGIVEIEMMENL